MNILTFDIEEWFLEKHYFGNHSGRYSEYDAYLDKILETLDEGRVKGTFFCVGGMATDFPEVIRKIESAGHEVGCHSFQHVWLNKMSREEVLEDTHKSVDMLEQCIGKKVKSYRAPAFSIGNSNKYVIEILAHCGISRDASIFPAERDFGGFPQFGQNTHARVSYGDSEIKEFPISTTILGGHELAYSGGGYFRFFPLWFVKSRMAKSDYNMTYFHIGDLVPESLGLMSKDVFESYFKIPGTLKNRISRYIKSNLWKSGAFDKMVSLVQSMDFVNLEQADAMIDWEKTPSILL